MIVTTQEVAKDFWIVKADRKYKGVVRLNGGLYFPWFEASQIGEPQETLEAAADALASL